MPDAPTPPPAPPTDPAPPAATSTPPASPPATDPPPSEPKDTDWKSEARKWEQRAKDNKSTGEQSATQLAAVLKALGKNPDGSDAPTDPAAAQQQIEQAQASAWATAVENQVLRIKDVDADRLLDSRAFIESLDDFADDVDNPHSAEFRTKLAAHVKKYVDKNPGFKSTPTPSRSGGEFPGGAGAGTPITEDQLKSMTPEQIAKALDEGKLAHLL